MSMLRHCGPGRPISTGRRWSLASGVHGVGPPGRASGWATAAAVSDLATTVSSALGAVGARVGSAAGLVRQAAGAYEAADARSARRLNRVG